MLGITQLKKGTLIELDGSPYRVVDYGQKQMGRGGSIVNVKLKNLIDGSVQNKTFKGNDKIESAEVNLIDVQFLYADEKSAYFMDNTTYEQFEIPIQDISDSTKFLKDGMNLKAQKYTGRIVGVELPTKVKYEVSSADPGIKGDTVSSVLKSATIETGARIQVPLFIKVGDTIVVDTRDGSYVSRA